MVSLPGQWSDCFWSYVRNDNTNMRGRIDHLREDLAAQYAFETGEQLNIFVDGNDIGWGQDWQDTLDVGVGRTVFFIPLVTPNYIRSDACRDEILKFNAICKARGIIELILPIVLSNPGFISTDHPDEVVRIIATANYQPFHNAIRADRDSQQWMEAVYELVVRLSQAQQRVEEKIPAILQNEVNLSLPSRRTEAEATDSNDDSEDGTPDEEPDSPGLLELTEELNMSLEGATASLNKAVADFNVLSDILAEHGIKAGGATDPNAYKAAILKMARVIEQPALALEASASQAQRDITDTDRVIQEIHNVLGRDTQSPVLTQYRDTFGSSLAAMGNINEAVQNLEELVPQMADAEKISVVLKKALRPARIGVLMLRDAARTAVSWSE